MCDTKISDRRAVHEQNNLLGRAGKEIIAKLASMKRVAAANPEQRSRNSTGQNTSLSPSGNLPNGTTSLESRSLPQDAPDRNVIFRCREVPFFTPAQATTSTPHCISMQYLPNLRHQDRACAN